MNIHNVMADIAADILRPVTLPVCQGCRNATATAYAVWHFSDAGQIGDAGGAYLCAECQNKLELSGAKIVYK